jgi:hypothetical protein
MAMKAPEFYWRSLSLRIGKSRWIMLRFWPLTGVIMYAKHRNSEPKEVIF